MKHAILLLMGLAFITTVAEAQNQEDSELLLNELRARLLFCRMHLKGLELPDVLGPGELNRLEGILGTHPDAGRREAVRLELLDFRRGLEGRMGQAVDRHVRELVPRLPGEPTAARNVVRRIHLLGLWTELRQRARLPIPVGLVSILESLRQAPASATWRYRAVDGLLPQVASDPLPNRIEASHLPTTTRRSLDPRSLMIRLGDRPGEKNWDNPFMVAVFLAGLGLLTLFVLRLWHGGDQSYRIALAHARAQSSRPSSTLSSPSSPSSPPLSPSLALQAEAAAPLPGPAARSASSRGPRPSEREILGRLAWITDCVLSPLRQGLAMVPRCHDDPRALFPHLLGSDFDGRFAPLLGPPLKEALRGLSALSLTTDHPAFPLISALLALGDRKDFEELSAMAERGSMTIPTSELARRALLRLEELHGRIDELLLQSNAFLEARRHALGDLLAEASAGATGPRNGGGWPLPEEPLPTLHLPDPQLARSLVALLGDCMLHAPVQAKPMSVRCQDLEAQSRLRRIELLLPAFPKQKESLLRASLGPLEAVLHEVRVDEEGLHLILDA